MNHLEEKGGELQSPEADEMQDSASGTTPGILFIQKNGYLASERPMANGLMFQPDFRARWA